MQHPQWSYKAVIYEMNVRQLTVDGTLRAATERLEFLHSIGVDAVWLMPIYPIGEVNRKGTLGSYYSIRDYCAVNEEFGTIADFDAFVSKAHSLGVKVLLDWVANHTARDARWTTEKPADWYERDSNGVPVVPWDWTDTAKLNYDNHDVWQGQIDAMKFWLARGIDGFRCDMAMLVPIEFWQEVSAELHAINAEVFLLAEAETQNLFEHAFDACYGWEVFHAMEDVAKQRCRINRVLDTVHSSMRSYPNSAMRLMFTSNHDENSWQGADFKRWGEAAEAMAVLSFLIPCGLPLIYTGQEVGYDHSFEFFERDPIPSYEPNATTDFYRRLTSLKHNNDALSAGEQAGAFITINNNAEDCLLIMVRESYGSRVVAIMNMSPYTVQAVFNTGIYAGDYTDAMSGEPTTLATSVDRIMAPWAYQILTK